MTELEMTAAPMPEATWAADEVQPLLPPTGPSMWQQKARCFYSPSGALMVDYHDTPYVEPQPWQNAGPVADPLFSPPPTPYYTAEAVNTNFCVQCNRSFASPNAVLQHLRDHQAHRDGPESYEAAYVLRCQEEGYYAPHGNAHWNSSPDLMMGTPAPWPHMEYDSSGTGEDFQVLAPPSDIYTGSESGSGNLAVDETAFDGAARLTLAASGGGPVEGMPAAKPAGRQLQHVAGRGPAGAGAKGGRAARAGDRRTHQGRGVVPRTNTAPPPKPEDESAFPPLSATSSPAPKAPSPAVNTRKWAAAASGTARKLRADATEYQPCSPPASDSASSGQQEGKFTALASPPESPASPVSPVSPTPKSVTLNVSAPAWAPA